MRSVSLIVAGLLSSFVAPGGVYGQDANGNGIADRFELPGTQRNPALPATGGTFNIDAAIFPPTDCQSCHTTADDNGPFPPWSGSMMANASRDPVFWAQLDVAEADEATNASLVGARDICLRCHVPKGWLEGRSSGSAAAFQGMAMLEDDLFGVQCAFCHRLVDRLDPAADAVDQIMIDGVKTNPDVTLRVPPSYGNAMYVVDRVDVRRGPFDPTQIGWSFLTPLFVSTAADWPPAVRNTHPVKNSPFHRSSNLCATCHDVSNPGWPPTPGGTLANKGETQANFPIERTWTEWNYSQYSTMGEDGNCQSCHMNGPLNAVTSGGVSGQAFDPSIHQNDVHVHDFTGGNVWIPRVIAEMVNRFQATKGNNPATDCPSLTAAPTQAEWDAFLAVCYADVLRTLYPAGTFATAGSENPPSGFDATAYEATAVRATATLQRAADLSGSRPPGGDLTVRVWNKTGHKLPTGYPEGRRMWLNVQFRNIDPTSGNEALVAESGEYDETTGTPYHDFNLDNLAGPKSYDRVTYTNGSGGALASGRRTQVYEGRAHHTPSGAEFHFILNNEWVKDNRIPPLGWNRSMYEANNAGQVTSYADQMTYHDATTGPLAIPPVIESAYNFDEVDYPVPTATSDVAEVKLYYQSVSREYIEELVAAGPHTLVYPPGGGGASANGFTRADLLEHAWRTFSFGGLTRFPPVEVKKLRIALIDGDGDGLPNDWETANGLDPTSATGANGRHGDFDLDGRSNYLEFQEGTPANSADALRDPLDLVLVLDFSGSMGDPVPAGSNPKVQALKDAVDLFLKTWQQYAIQTDRIGVVDFSSTVDIEGGGIIDLSTLPAGTSVEDRINQLIAAVRARAAGGWTAMGGGIQTALNMLQTGGTGHRKHVIVFSNGMQNYNPMVQRDGSGNYSLGNLPVSSADGVYGNSGVTDAGGPAFGVLLNTLGIPIHTIGIGVSETADNRWVDLINFLAANTTGKHQFISRAFELEGSFLHDLIESLRGFASPVMVAEEVRQLPRSETAQTLEFQVDAAAEKATFVLSWAGAEIPGRLRLDLTTPDGTPAQNLGLVTDGANYQIGTYYFPLARDDGLPVAHEGTWTMTVSRRGFEQGEETFVRWRDEVDFRAYLLVDVPEMDFQVNFSQPRYQVGDELILEAAVLDRSQPIRTLDSVVAAIMRPRQGFGTFLSQTRIDTGQVRRGMDVGGDSLPDLAASKMRLALMNPQLARSVLPIREEIVLYDDGDPEHGDLAPNDGIFSAIVGTAQVPGLVSADVRMDGSSARTGALARRLTVNTVVEHAPFSGVRSLFGGRRVETLENGDWLVHIRVTPVDEFGNYLGPGYKHLVNIDVPGFAPDSPVQDMLDGSYQQAFRLPPGAFNTTATVTVGMDVILEDRVSSFVEDPLSGQVSLWIVLLAILLLLLVLLLFVWALRQGAIT